MSDEEIQPGAFSISRFLAQLILVPPTILVIGGLAWGLGLEFGILATRTHESMLVMNGLGYLACALVSFGFGRLVRHWFPRFAGSGGFVWVAPVMVLLCALLIDEHSVQFAGVSRFFVARAGMGQEGIGLFLFTLPAFGCCFYSLGAGLPKRFWRPRGRQD